MQLESSVTLFDDNKVEDRFAELQITADGITSEVSKKVGNDEIISRINQSAEAVTINANKVNIEGATIFSSGRLSQSSLDGAYDASGSATGAVNNLKSDLSSSSGTTVIDGGHISAGSISIARLPATARNDTYITDIGSDGIRVHDSHTSNNAIVIDSEGMEVFKGGQTDAYSVAKYGSSARIGKTNDTNVAITAASTDSGIKMNVKNRAGTSSVRIADIGFDSTQGYEDSKNFPKGAWYTLGDRAGTNNQRGYYSLVSGFNNIAAHSASVAFGINNSVYSPAAMAIGENNTIGNSASSSVTDYDDTKYQSANSSLAVGWGLIVSDAQQIVSGYYNWPITGAQLIIGNGSSSNRKNSFVVYENGNATLEGQLTQGSDRRLKEHIDYLGDEAVEFIDGLKPAHYFKDGEKHVGFYAQDVAEVDKWDCMTGEMNGYMTLGYTELIAPLVAYVQKLEKRIEELERTNK